jgi:hypothetical protein
MHTQPTSDPIRKHAVWRRLSVVGTTLIATLTLPVQLDIWYQVIFLSVTY